MIKIKKKNFLNAFIFLIILILGMTYILLNIDYSRYKFSIILLFFINGSLIIINLTKSSQNGYSLNDMFWLFMLFFMFISRFIEYVYNEFPCCNSNFITYNIIVETNIYIFVFITIYIIFYYFFKIWFNKKHLSSNKSCVFELKNIKTIMNIGFYISLLVSIYIIINVGFLDLFSRATSNLGMGQTKSLIIDKSLRAFPFVTLIIYLLYKHKKGYFYSKFKLIILILIFFLTHIPTGLPRFQVATVYIALFLVWIENFKNKYIFKILMIFGILVVFPFLNVFRYVSYNALLYKNLNLPNPLQLFVEGHFDAYSIISRSIIYVENQGITFGKQLFGALFFYIPRSLWKSKPIGSGHLVAKYFNWPHTNVSFPFIAEGYINFGLIGIILFAIVLAYLIIKLDYLFLEKYINNNYFSILRIYYPALIGFIFYILRGDLMSSFAFTIGYFFPLLFLFFIDKLLLLLKNQT